MADHTLAPMVLGRNAVVANQAVSTSATSDTITVTAHPRGSFWIRVVANATNPTTVTVKGASGHADLKIGPIAANATVYYRVTDDSWYQQPDGTFVFTCDQTVGVFSFFCF